EREPQREDVRQIGPVGILSQLVRRTAHPAVTQLAEVRQGQAREQAQHPAVLVRLGAVPARDRKSTRLNSSHVAISYAVFCLKKTKAVRVSGGPLWGDR